MKEFTWQEVLDYLDENLDKEFNYCSALRGDGNCLMASFFESKGVGFALVSYAGFEAFENLDKTIQVAKIVDPPIDRVERIHCVGEQQPTLGRHIKEEIEKLQGA